MTSLPHLDLIISLLHPQAALPHKAHPTDACFDLTACEGITIESRSTGVVRLGFALQLSPGWEAQVRGRSGLAARGILAHQGTIDHLYRREVKVIIHNLTNESFCVESGDRIAQMAVAPVYPVRILVGEIEPSQRGGFGSTGLR